MKTFRCIINEQDDSTMAPAEEPMEQPEEQSTEEIPEQPMGAQTEVYFGSHTVSHTENIGGYDIPFAPVRSSHIDEIGYNSEEQLLYIRYSSGALYVYSNVDEEEWRGLADAGEMGASPSESKGKYVGMYIKGPNPRTAPLKAYERVY